MYLSIRNASEKFHKLHGPFKTALKAKAFALKHYRLYCSASDNPFSWEQVGGSEQALATVRVHHADPVVYCVVKSLGEKLS